MNMFSNYQSVKLYLLVVLFLCISTRVNSQTLEQIDLCKTNPCANKGICVQTNISPGYKCQCYGTGFYGTRCTHTCPKGITATHSNRRTGPLPTECVVI